MISYSRVETAMYEAMKTAALKMPPDVSDALQRAMNEESDPLAKMHLELSLQNARFASEGKGLICGDTGFPLFFVKAGNRTEIEGGFGRLWDAARAAVVKATAESFLRPTMVDPLTRSNPGNNIFRGMPKVELSFEGEGNSLEIIAAPKGGGSEIFGTFYKMLFPSDGKTGIMKFIIECIKDGCYAGKICPPAIVGVGIGGTADLCMKLAKEAALLRTVGTHSSNPEIAEMETKLLSAIRESGIGPMGSKGTNAVMALNIETAATHTAALPVAVNAQCLVGRRWKAIISGDDSKITYTGIL